MNTKNKHELSKTIINRIIANKTKEEIAVKVLEIAKENGIVTQNAQKIHTSLNIETNKPIPDILNKIIAEILVFIYKINRKS